MVVDGWCEKLLVITVIDNNCCITNNVQKYEGPSWVITINPSGTRTNNRGCHLMIYNHWFPSTFLIRGRVHRSRLRQGTLFGKLPTRHQQGDLNYFQPIPGKAPATVGCGGAWESKIISWFDSFGGNDLEPVSNPFKEESQTSQTAADCNPGCFKRAEATRKQLVSQSVS